MTDTYPRESGRQRATGCSRQPVPQPLRRVPPPCAVRRAAVRLRSTLLEELARRVVGEDLAAGLARRAVVDGVAGVLDGPDRVAAHRARLAGSPVHAARAGPSTSSCRRACARTRGPRRRTRGSPRRPSSRRRGPSLPVIANGESFGPVAAPRWPAAGRCPAIASLVAEEAVEPHRLARRTARPARRARSRSASGPELVERRRRRARSSVGTHHTPARRSVPCSVSSSAGPSPRSNTNRAWPPRGFADLLGVDEQPPALHQVDDERDRLEVTSRYLPRRPTLDAAAAP